MATVRCPICGRQFDVEKTPAMPFCSHRCRRIDLGRWLDQRYGFPVEADEEAEFDPHEGDQES